ncbi:MAG: efflux RND transporter permease subunit, partial [Bacteroidales bacterium]|nr:efflux RND transporter permease subunit [Bacteroidales bacterium]
IVIDNIDQHFKNKTFEESCVAGTNEIIRPLLSSVLTTCAVFLPLIFLSGIAGELFFDQAIAVTIGLCVSFLVSITLLPVYYRILHRNSSSTIPQKELKWSIFSEIEQLYGRGYDALMKRKRLFTGTLSLFTLLGLYLFFTAHKEAFPAFEDSDVLTHIAWNENINIQEAEQRIAQTIKAMDYDISQFSAYVGVQQFILSHLDDIEEAEAILYYNATSPQNLEEYKTAFKKQMELHSPLAQVRFQKPPNVFSQIFEDDEALLNVNYVSDNKRTLISPQTAKANMKQLRHDLGVEVNALGLQEFLVIKPRTSLMVQYGITAPQLYSRLRQALDGYQVATLKSGSSYTPIVLSDQEHTIQEVLASLYLTGRGEAQYPIRELVSLEKALDYKEILGGKEGAFVRVTPQLDDENVASMVHTIKAKHQPSQGTFFLSGHYFKNQKLFWEMLVVLSISILLLYFILAAQFESLRQPLIVLLEIPIDIAGAILVLKLGGGTVNIMSMIGIVVMSGIIINDSILKIDTINRIRKTGVSIDKAIHQAGIRRLKPIVMTSITTILALLPFLFGNSMGNVLQRPLALTIIGGMTVGTFVSLYLIPMMYQWIEKDKPNA